MPQDPEISAPYWFYADGLPDYTNLASYLLYIATGEAVSGTLEPDEDWRFYSSGDADYYLLYRPDLEYLKSEDSMLTEWRAKRIHEKDRRAVVFGTGAHVGQLVCCIIPRPLHRSHAVAAWRSQFCGRPPQHSRPAGGFALSLHRYARSSAQGTRSGSETIPDDAAHAAVTSDHGQAPSGGPVSGGRRIALGTASLMSRLRL